MRPTVTEQLHHFGRILSTTVAPAVDDPYAAEILRRLIVDLRKLETCWDQAEAFMAWDVGRLEALLTKIGPGAATAREPEDLAERQQRLRAVLAAEIPGLDLTPAGRALLDGPVLDYFTDRLARDPMANRRHRGP